jgi:predicted nuclease with RNAse H fold
MLQRQYAVCSGSRDLKADKYFAGIDPSGSSEKYSGLCLMNEQKEVRFIGRWKLFEEILAILKPFQSQLEYIGIDGPLQPPHELGRCCFTDGSPQCEHKQSDGFKGRYCEYLLIKNGYRCFLTTRNSFVRPWIYRCFLLNDFLLEHHFSTVEVFPYATRRILFPNLTGKKQQLSFRWTLQKELQSWGLIIPPSGRVYSHDELDAALAALTVLLHFQHKSILLGSERDGFICIPCR